MTTEDVTTKVISAQVQLVAIEDDLAGQRIDNFLRTRLKGVPKSLVYRLLRKGQVRVNVHRARKKIIVEMRAMLQLDPGDEP